jgi:hypothetical protein
MNFMQSNQHRRILSHLLLSSILIVTVLAAATFAAKDLKTYPEEGKITGNGQNEHTQTTGGGATPQHSRSVYSHLYTVQTDTKIYQLDCGKLPTFHSTGGECGGDKKFETGDVIHFRTEKGNAYVSIVNGGQPGEQKLRVINEQLRSDAKPADAPPDAKQ